MLDYILDRAMRQDRINNRGSRDELSSQLISCRAVDKAEVRQTCSSGPDKMWNFDRVVVRKLQLVRPSFCCLDTPS